MKLTASEATVNFTAVKFTASEVNLTTGTLPTEEALASACLVNAAMRLAMRRSTADFFASSLCRTQHDEVAAVSTPL